MYSEENVAALRPLDKIFKNCGLPFMKLRKASGILNAIEMQIEDNDYSRDVVTHLLRAIKEQVRWLKSEPLAQDVDKAIDRLSMVLGIETI